MSRKWKKINSKLIYSNPWIKLHEDSVFRPDGKEGIYAFLEKKAGNFIIAQDNNFVYFHTWTIYGYINIISIYGCLLFQFMDVHVTFAIIFIWRIY